MNNSNHSNILIVGGGCAGISVAAKLKSLKTDLSISIIEPSDKSLYQAAWTLVGAGCYDVNKTIKTMSSVMPSFVNLGAYIDTGTMVDTWATVGSCSQIGKNVHLSGGVGIGGVLEPMQATPTIIEDD